MYADEVKASGYLDNNRRRELTLEFFEPIRRDCGNNLIFYYANHSNPLSEEEVPRYVMIGVSRIVRVGEELFYNSVTPAVAERYAGGVVWAREITSSYPEEGVRLPYHRYLDDSKRLAEMAVFPENQVLCKYGSKHLSDDEAIGVLEQFLSKVRLLKEIGDETEDWNIREAWLLKVIAELWTHRGIYPGLLKALEAAGAVALIDGAKDLCISEGHEEAHATAFEVLESNRDNALTSGLDSAERNRISRNWRLLDDSARMLLRDILPRFDLSAQTMAVIASERRGESGLTVSAHELAANPYLLAEMYCGDDAADPIAWSVVDRGVLPSPDLGGKPLANVDFNDERRFRALCVEHLRREPNHTFRFGKDLITEIVVRMERLPAWKQAQFSERYFEVDAEFLAGALTLVAVEPGLAVYQKSVFEDERKVEVTLRELASRPEIDLRRPVTISDWSAWIYKTESSFAEKGGEDYSNATREQIDVCQRLFRFTVGYGKDVPHGGKFKRNESVEENLELAYAVSIHKAQGSEFGHTFVIIPASKKRPVSAELVYTALTRASRHCTLLLENDVTSLLDARRRENAQTPQINSSLFALHIAKAALRDRSSWYEAGKIHEALSGDMLRSKSEVIIANLLHEREIPFQYEEPLFAGDGTLRLPDFTVTWHGQTFFWEHLGRLDLTDYAKEWEMKRAWYEHWFPGQLLTTEEGPQLSMTTAMVIENLTQGAVESAD